MANEFVFKDTMPDGRKVGETAFAFEQRKKAEAAQPAVPQRGTAERFVRRTGAIAMQTTSQLLDTVGLNYDGATDYWKEAVEANPHTSAARPGDAWDKDEFGIWLLENLGDSVASTAPAVVAAILSRGMTLRAMAPQAAAMAAAATGAEALAVGAQAARAAKIANRVGLGASWLVNSNTQGYETADRLRDEGLTPTAGSVLPAALAKGALDTFGLGQIARSFGLGKYLTRNVEQEFTRRGLLEVLKDEGIKSAAFQVMKEGGKSAAAESLTEAAQSAIDIGVVKFLKDESLWKLHPQEMAEIVDAGIAGGVLGGAMGAAGGAFSEANPDFTAGRQEQLNKIAADIDARNAAIAKIEQELKAQREAAKAARLTERDATQQGALAGFEESGTMNIPEFGSIVEWGMPAAGTLEAGETGPKVNSSAPIPVGSMAQETMSGVSPFLFGQHDFDSIMEYEMQQAEVRAAQERARQQEMLALQQQADLSAVPNLGDVQALGVPAAGSLDAAFSAPSVIGGQPVAMGEGYTGYDYAGSEFGVADPITSAVAEVQAAAGQSARDPLAEQDIYTVGGQRRQKLQEFVLRMAGQETTLATGTKVSFSAGDNGLDVNIDVRGRSVKAGRLVVQASNQGVTLSMADSRHLAPRYAQAVVQVVHETQRKFPHQQVKVLMPKGSQKHWKKDAQAYGAKIEGDSFTLLPEPGTLLDGAEVVQRNAAPAVARTVTNQADTSWIEEFVDDLGNDLQDTLDGLPNSAPHTPLIVLSQIEQEFPASERFEEDTLNFLSAVSPARQLGYIPPSTRNTPALNAVAKEAYKTFTQLKQKFMPAEDVRILFVEDSTAETDGLFNKYQHPVTGETVYLVTVKIKPSHADSVSAFTEVNSVVAHELGHALHAARWEQAPQTLKDAVRAEYNKRRLAAYSQVGTISTDAVQQERNAFWQLQQDPPNPAPLNASKENRKFMQYAYRDSELFAENFAETVFSLDLDLMPPSVQTYVRNWIKTVADFFRQVFKGQVSDRQAFVAFYKWMAKTAEETRQTIPIQAGDMIVDVNGQPAVISHAFEVTTVATLQAQEARNREEIEKTLSGGYKTAAEFANALQSEVLGLTPKMKSDLVNPTLPNGTHYFYDDSAQDSGYAPAASGVIQRMETIHSSLGQPDSVRVLFTTQGTSGARVYAHGDMTVVVVNLNTNAGIDAKGNLTTSITALRTAAAQAYGKAWSNRLLAQAPARLQQDLQKEMTALANPQLKGGLVSANSLAQGEDFAGMGSLHARVFSQVMLKALRRGDVNSKQFVTEFLQGANTFLESAQVITKPPVSDAAGLRAWAAYRYDAGLLSVVAARRPQRVPATQTQGTVAAAAVGNPAGVPALPQTTNVANAQTANLVLRGFSFWSKVLSMPHLIDKFKVPQLRQYWENVKGMVALKNEVLVAADLIGQDFKSLSHKAQAEVSNFLFWLNDRSEALTHRFSEQEIIQLFAGTHPSETYTQLHKLDPKGKEFARMVKNAVDMTNNYASVLERMEYAQMVYAAQPQFQSTPQMQQFLDRWRQATSQADRDTLMLATFGGVLTPEQQNMAAALASIQQRMGNLKNRNYVPKMRHGQHTLRITATQDTTYDGVLYKAGQTMFFYAWDNEGQRNREAKHLAQVMAQYQVSLESDRLSDEVHQLSGLPRAFLDHLKNDPNIQLTPAQRAQLDVLALEYVPSKAFTKHFLKRDNVLGYKTDADSYFRSFSSYMFRAASTVSKTQYTRQLNGSIAEMRNAKNQLRQAGLVNNSAWSQLADFSQQHLDYVMKPDADWAGVRSFISAWYLAYMPRSAMANLYQVPMVTYPWLASKYGDVKAIQAITSAYTKTLKALQSGKYPPEYAKALQQAMGEGHIDSSAIVELGASGDSNLFDRATGLSTQNLWARWVIDKGFVMFRGAEKINRRTTFVAAFDLAFQQTGSFDAAYAEAVNSVGMTQFDMSKEGRAQLFRGGKGVLLQFNQHMFNAAYLAFGGFTLNRQALGLALRTMAVAALVAGAEGLPFAGLGLDIFDLFASMYKKLTGEDYTHSDARGDIRELAQTVNLDADLIMHGMSRKYGLGPLSFMSLFGAPNVDLSGSLSLGYPGSWAQMLRNNTGTPEDRWAQVVESLGGAAFSVAHGVYKAASSDDPNQWKSMDSALPAFARAISQGNRWIAQGGEVMKDGSVIHPVTEANTIDAVYRMAGLTPTSLAQAYELRGLQLESVAYWQIKRQKLMQEYMFAQQQGDAVGLREAQAAIQRYNRSVYQHEVGRQLMILGKSLSASGRERERRIQRIESGMAPTRNLQQIYLQQRARFGQGEII